VYRAHEFQDDSAGRAYSHIRNNPFGIVVARAGGTLHATHLPFLLDDEESPSGLLGHCALRNESLAALAAGQEVLVIFSGPDAYISPTLYRAEPDVPTWNYSAVHLHGRYRRVGQSELHAILRRSVDRFERTRTEPWQLDSLPASLVRSLSRGVLGFRIETTRIEGGYKLSQDKLAADVESVMSGLGASNLPRDRAVAEDMRTAGIRGRSCPPTTDPESWLGPLR